MLAHGMTDESRLNEHPVRGIDRTNGAVVIHLAGELDLYNAPEVRAALLELCSEQPERLVVDLGEVDFVDSTALGVLIEARTKLEDRDDIPARRARSRDPSGALDLGARPAPRSARHRRRRTRRQAELVAIVALDAAEQPLERGFEPERVA